MHTPSVAPRPVHGTATAVRQVPAPLQWSVLALSCGVFLALGWRLRGFVTDDAWISVRYAENLAQGAGPVWNPGGPRVEGFSNPLLVYLEALADLCGWSAMSAARVLGVASGLMCIGLVHHLGRAVVGDRAAMVGTLLTGVSAPFALWAVGGLETTLTAAVLTAAVLVLARSDGGRPVAAGALLALLPWLRPEGLVAALAVAGLGEGFLLLRRRTRGRALRRLLGVAGLPVLSQAVLELVRLRVYGHLLPNSVLYKSGTGGAFDVAEKFVDQSALVLVLAGTGTVLLRRRQLLLVVPVAVYLTGSIGTLDSANAYSRFFMPVWPQVALLAGVGAAAVVAGVAGRRGAVAGATLAGLTSLATVIVLPANIEEVDDRQQRYTACLVAAREDVTRYLVAHTSPDSFFAISDAGLVPARAGGRTAVDSFLLNDPLIQQTGPLDPKQRADVVHDREPDLLVLASRSAEWFDPYYPTDRAIGAHPAAEGFELVHVGSGAVGCGYHLMVLSR